MFGLYPEVLFYYLLLYYIITFLPSIPSFLLRVVECTAVQLNTTLLVDRFSITNPHLLYIQEQVKLGACHFTVVPVVPSVYLDKMTTSPWTDWVCAQAESKGKEKQGFSEAGRMDLWKELDQLQQIFLWTRSYRQVVKSLVTSQASWQIKEFTAEAICDTEDCKYVSPVIQHIDSHSLW